MFGNVDCYLHLELKKKKKHIRWSIYTLEGYLFYGFVVWHPLYKSSVLWFISSFSFIYKSYCLLIRKNKIKNLEIV